MDPQRFDELVSDALDLIPPELADAMDNVVVLVANRHPQHENLLGQYEGVALTERGSDTPDRCLMPSRSTARRCWTPATLRMRSSTRSPSR